MTHYSNFKVGDRVLVTDPTLALLREIFSNATGEKPKPNHHGTVEAIWDDGTILINFDDGVGAPYPPSEVRYIDGGAR